jgi:uncharacterized protein YggU (UPF0235/DUF167 family)
MTALCDQRLGPRKSQVEIVAGGTYRRKMTRVIDLSAQKV